MKDFQQQEEEHSMKSHLENDNFKEIGAGENNLINEIGL